MSKADFIEYYESSHAPLILTSFPTITAYRRNYIEFAGAFVSPDAAPFDFDVITEIEFTDRAGYDDMLARAEVPETGEAIAADEENFLSRQYTRMFLTETRSNPIAKNA